MFVSGNITMQICATSNSELHINNSNGNVNITLSSFQKNNINVSSFNGCYKNLYYPSGQYDISGKISSMNGNIYIKYFFKAKNMIITYSLLSFYFFKSTILKSCTTSQMS